MTPHLAVVGFSAAKLLSDPYIAPFTFSYYTIAPSHLLLVEHQIWLMVLKLLSWVWMMGVWVISDAVLCNYFSEFLLQFHDPLLNTYTYVFPEQKSLIMYNSDIPASVICWYCLWWYLLFNYTTKQLSIYVGYMETLDIVILLLSSRGRPWYSDSVLNC